MIWIMKPRGGTVTVAVMQYTNIDNQPNNITTSQPSIPENYKNSYFRVLKC